MSDIYPDGMPRVDENTEIRDKGTGEVRTFHVWAVLHAQQFNRDVQWGREQILSLIETRAMLIVDSEADAAFLASHRTS